MISSLFMTRSETYVNVELRPWRHIPNPRLFPWESAHRRVCESTTNRPAHNTKALNVFCNLRKRRKKQSNIGQRSRCYNPWRAFGLCKERISHRQDRVFVRNRQFRWFGEKVSAVQTRVTWEDGGSCYYIYRYGSIDGQTRELTVDIRCMDSRSTEWLPVSWVHWNIGFTDCFQNTPCVGRCVFQRGISMDRSDAQELQ